MLSLLYLDGRRGSRHVRSRALVRGHGLGRDPAVDRLLRQRHFYVRPAKRAPRGGNAHDCRTLNALTTVNSFAALPDAFYTRLAPQPLNHPRLLHANPDAAALIGLDPSAFATPEFLAVFSGQQPLPGGDTLAAVYSGHPVRHLGRPIGRRARASAGRSAGPAGSWSCSSWRHDAVFAHGRRPRGAAPSVREFGRRGHAWPGHSDDARAVPGGVGRSGIPRDRGNRRHRHAHGAQLRALLPRSSTGRRDAI